MMSREWTETLRRDFKFSLSGRCSTVQTHVALLACALTATFGFAPAVALASGSCAGELMRSELDRGSVRTLTRVDGDICR